MGLALGLLAVMAGLLAASDVAAQAVREGLALCGGSVIPALFPFLVVSRLFVATGSAAALGRLLAPLTRRMLGISGPGGTAVLLGLLGGYPVGAQTAGELVRTGAISRQEGQRLLLFCNNCGPAFALGVAGVGCFGSLRAGVWLWLIHVSAAVLMALLTRSTSSPEGRTSPPQPISAAASTKSPRVPESRRMPPVSSSSPSGRGCSSPVRAVSSRVSTRKNTTKPQTWSIPSPAPRTAAVLEGSGLQMRGYLSAKAAQAVLSAALAVPISRWVR